MRRALAFLTPFGGARTPSPAALDWFGLVGAWIGTAVGLLWWLAAKAWPAAAAAAVALASDVVLTGYLHLDGLADAADGLLPPLDRDRRLEVMRDPSIGAFGTVTLVTVLLLRFGAFASVGPAPLVIAGLWCGSRTAMAVVARTVPYARSEGLASAFLEAPSVDARTDAESATGGSAAGQRYHPRRAFGVANIFGLVLAVALAFAGRQVHGVLAITAELVAVVFVVLLAERRIGGFTGDVLGAAGVLGETAGLLVLAARW